jgi:hypothetical protein
MSSLDAAAGSGERRVTLRVHYQLLDGRLVLRE